MPVTFVDAPGILKVRTVAAGTDVDLIPPVDMIEFQQTSDSIPDDFCACCRITGRQRIVHCLLCCCVLRSMAALELHLGGKKHARKVLEKKSHIWDTANEEETTEKSKKKTSTTSKGRKMRQMAKMTLKERLMKNKKSGCPLLGLEFIEEYLSGHPADDPLYICRLAGCNNAWGYSFSMFYHLCGRQMKHNRNYLQYVCHEEDAYSLTRDMVLARSEKENIRLRWGREDRDYSAITRFIDVTKYDKIRRLSTPWEEPNRRLLGEGAADPLLSGTPSEVFEPSNKYRRRESSACHEKVDRDFVKDAEGMVEALDNNQISIEENLNAIEKGEGSAKLTGFLAEQLRQHRIILDMIHKSANAKLVPDDIKTLKEALPGLIRRTERALTKDRNPLEKIREAVAAHEGKVKDFIGSRRDDDYVEVSQQGRRLKRSVEQFAASDESALKEKNTLLELCCNLEKELEERAEDLSTILEREMEKSKEKCCSQYKEELKAFVNTLVMPYYRNSDQPRMVRIKDEKMLDQQVANISEKIFTSECKIFESSNRPWKRFSFAGINVDNVRDYVTKKMELLPPIVD